MHNSIMSENIIFIIFLGFQLCFKKGDKITVTQKDDEGWWEGTLGDKTGWFPSNYVKECKGKCFLITINKPL